MNFNNKNLIMRKKFNNNMKNIKNYKMILGKLIIRLKILKWNHFKKRNKLVVFFKRMKI